MYYKRKNNKDLKYILSNLRAQDEHELRLVFGASWFDCIWSQMRKSKDCKIAYTNDGAPIAVFGVMAQGDIGIVGLFSTVDFEKEQKSFLVLGKKWIEDCEKRYRLLRNKVYSTNTKAIRWLKWLGFTVEANLGMGDKFLEFYKVCSIKKGKSQCVD